jgi:hypothetical protein
LAGRPQDFLYYNTRCCIACGEGLAWNYWWGLIRLIFGIASATMVVVNEGLARAIQQLGAREAQLERELAQVRAAMDALRGVVASMEAMAPRTMAQPLPDLGRLTYAAAAVEVLQRSNRQPLSTKTLLARLASAGRQVRGSDPYRTLYRILRNKPQTFRNISGEWALADWYEGETSAA